MPMTPAELQKVLRAADPRAVLVSPRILERVVQAVHGLRGPAWSLPHRDGQVTDRQTLFKHADQSDLDLEPDQLLPETVILLTRPPAEELGDLERPSALLKYWRLLFHMTVHLSLDDRGGANHGPGVAGGAGRLDNAGLHRRIAEIGRTEFEEVRAVLIDDGMLPAAAGDRSTYVEFAAVYLETRHFAPALLSALFPGLRDRARVDRMLAADVDADALFAATRLAEAPAPAAPDEARWQEAESHERYWALVRSAERASLAGNAVGAVILRTRAWRIAPAALGPGTREQALADLGRLTARLAAALPLTATEAEEWAEVLPLLLDKADQGARPAEARLLDDLQRVCLDHERDVYALDAVEWMLSAGRRPIKRPLPGLKLVRATRHLRAAAGRLTAVRLSDHDRQRLARLVQAAVAQSEDAVRTRFGRALEASLQDVGLRPANAPERVAVAKVVDEWLDAIVSRGFLTFSDLRDALSRNQLKMPDLADAPEFIRGDPLLRLDRRLASLLDGVYRPSEVYMRLIERVTALNFGTRTGRALTLWVTVPLGGAAVVLQVIGVLFHLLVDLEQRPGARLAHQVLVGPWLGHWAGPTRGPHPVWHFLLLGGLTAFLAGLIHAPRFRAGVRDGLSRAGRGVRMALLAVPRAILHNAVLRQVARSWPFQIVWWYLLKPLVACGLIWLIAPAARETPAAAGATLAIASLVINSRFGAAAGEAVRRGLTSLANAIRAGLLPGLYRLIVEVFKDVVDGVEFVLFTVDDWLRFHGGDTRLSSVTRTILATLWFPVSYVARFYMVVLIEPGFNPIKAPVSYLAAKVMIPLTVPLTRLLVGGLRPVLWDWLAYALVLPTVWLLPDAFGFLFWETKENWGLYRANRRRSVEAVAVGPHGETVKVLFRPGFHSGTVPRLFRKLRRAERASHRGRDRAVVRACRHHLAELEGAVGRFVSRELVAVLRESPSWHGGPPAVGRVSLAVNRADVELLPPDAGGRPLTIEFEHRAGWLMAGLRDAGWLTALDGEQRRTFAAALAGLYKLAGVDVVREQVEANLPAGTAWDVGAAGLVVRPAIGAPPAAAGVPADHAAGANGGGRLLFARTPLLWADWLNCWEHEPNGRCNPGLDGWDQELVPAAALRAAATAEEGRVSRVGANGD